MKGQNGFDLVKDFCTDPDTQSAGFSCLPDSNRFYVFGITRTQNVIMPQHGYLSAIDYAGNILWSRKILEPKMENSASSYLGMTKIGSNKFLTAGTIADYNIDSPNLILYPYFYSFNGNGDSIRYKVLTDSFLSKTINSLLFDRNSIITAGTKKDTSALLGHNLWLCKYDTTGSLIWEKQFLHYQNALPYAKRIVLSSDKQYYVVAGSMQDTISMPFLQCSGIMKIDTNGNQVWFKKIVRPNQSINDIDIVTNQSGGYYFVGSYSTSPAIAGIPQGSIVYYGKLNEQGDTIWTKTFQDSLNYCSGYQIEWSNDHKHLLIKAENGYHTPALIKIDTNGNVLWYRIIQHVYNWNDKYYIPNHLLQSFCVTPNEQYLMVGSIQGAHILGVFDMNGVITWLVLTDSNGCRYPGDPSCWPVSVKNVNYPTTGLKIYPNPNAGSFIVESPQAGMLYLYNMQGQLVMQCPISQNKTKMSLPATLQAGTYMGKFIGNDAQTTIQRLNYQP